MRKKLLPIIMIITVLLLDLSMSVIATELSKDEKAYKIISSYGINFSAYNQSYVTKAGYAKALLTLMRIDTASDEENVLRLVEMGFFPKDKAQSVDTYISMETVAEVTSRALGYGYRVDKSGAMQTAMYLKLFEGVKGNADDCISASGCYRVFYNMLDVNCMVDICYETTQSGRVEVVSTINNTETVLQRYLNGFMIKGIVLADENNALYGYKSYSKENTIYVKGEVIDTTNCPIRGQVGKNIEIYGIIEDGELKALCYIDAYNSSIKTIELEDIVSAVGFDATDSFEQRAMPCITYKGKEKALLSDRFTISYNGYSANSVSNSDFLGEYGSIELIDVDKDNKYDMVNIKKSLYLEVVSADVQGEKIVFKQLYSDISGQDAKYYINTHKGKINFYSKGRDISLVNVNAGAIAQINAKRIADLSKLSEIEEADIYIHSELYTGVVTSIDTANKKVGINGNEYSATAQLMSSVKLNVTYDFILTDELVAISARKSSHNEAYMYFFDYAKKGSITPEIEMGFYTLTSEKKIITLTERTKYTGPDENGTWQDSKVYKIKEMGKILDAHFTQRMLVRAKIEENGDLTLIMPKDMSSEPNYCGYDENSFTLETPISLADKGNLPTFGNITENYYAVSKTTVVIDDVNDVDNFKVMSYGADYSSLAGPSKFMMEGYVYDAVSDMSANIVVLKCDFSIPKNSNWQELLQGNPMIISNVKFSSDAVILEGYRSGKFITLQTDGSDAEVLYTSPYEQYTSKTCASQLKCGDIIIPMLNNVSGKMYTFLPILTPDSDGNSTPYYTSYWGGVDNSASFSAAFSTLDKNFDNKTIRLADYPTKKFAIPQIVYVCDISSGIVEQTDKNTYLQDAQSGGEADRVFVSLKKYKPSFIVLYRK